MTLLLAWTPGRADGYQALRLVVGVGAGRESWGRELALTEHQLCSATGVHSPHRPGGRGLIISPLDKVGARDRA